MARQSMRSMRPSIVVVFIVFGLSSVWVPRTPVAAAPQPPTSPAAPAAPLASPTGAIDTTLRASESSAGLQGNGSSSQAYLSDDGRFLTFESSASTLVGGDTNGDSDIFVRDLLTGDTSRVSVSSAGAQANNHSHDPAISGDGRYVIFRSDATNLVAGDTNAERDIFVHDRATGVTTRESLSSAGVQANEASTNPIISHDGRYLAFSSSASNLVAGDTNNASDVFVRDRHTDTVTRVSVSSAGAQSGQGSFDPALSADGRYVAFDSTATNFVSGDTNGNRDVFVHDRDSATTTRVSLDSSGTQANGSSQNAYFSADGRYVVFDSAATNLVSGDTNAAGDVFLHDRDTGVTERVSLTDADVQASGGASNEPAISADGRYIAFQSDATNLVSGDTNADRDVFVRDVVDDSTVRVSLTVAGGEGNHDSQFPDLGGFSGSVVAFGSLATNLVSGDTNGAQDVFVRQPADAPDYTNLGRGPQHSFESWDLGGGDALEVNVANGNLVLSHPLVRLPIRGSALSLALTYNSGDGANLGLGTGWRLNLQRQLTLHDDGSVTFVDADGARHTFTDPQTAGALTTYTRPERLYASLVKDTGAAAEFRLTYRDLAVDAFAISGSAALLVRSEDRFGNGVDLAYSGGNLSTVTDPASRQLSLTWDTAPTPDRLTSFTDWAYISGGVVQTGTSGSLRQYRFFYDADGRLAGWSDPLNTSASCPTGGSHLTCLSYSAGRLAAVGKTQTVTTFSAGTLGTTTRAISTAVTYALGRVASVTDAEQTALAGPATTFSWDAADEVTVERPTTTTRYELLDALDPWARVSSSVRVLDAQTEIERAVTWDTVYPIEPATVTDNVGAVLDAPARTISYTYIAESLGLVAKIVEPLTASDKRWTEYTYNANNDVTQTIVSAEGSGTDRTVTRYCYSSAASCPAADGLSLLADVAGYVDGVGGTGAGLDDHDTDVRTEYVSDAHGQVTQVIRHNRDATGAVLDDREDRFSFDANGNLTAEIVNYVNGTVTSPGDDVTPNATTLARTDLTTAHIYDTAGNRVSSADPRRAIETARGTSLAADDYVTRWTYDGLNRQLSEKTPTTPGLASTQATATSTYDELGAVRSATDFGGLVSASEFDRAGRTVRTLEDPASASARVTAITAYDADGRPLTVKDERQVDDAALGATTITYDAIGRQASVTEADGTAAESLTETEHDGLDRRTRNEVGVGGGSPLLTLYAYDLGGRTTTTDDGFTCAISTFDYRDLPLNATSGLAGDGCGAGTEQRTLTHTHDRLGRLTRSEVTAGVDSGDRTLDDVYDATGNRRTAATRVDNVTQSTTFSLNRLDQVTAEDRPDGSTAKTSYDPAGNPTDRCSWAPGATVGACQPVGTTPWTNPPTQVTSAVHDARNQRVGLADAAADSVTSYDPDHNYAVAAIYRATGSGREHQALYTYGERHRLTSITFQTCAANSSHICTDTPVDTGSNSYAYDDNHNRTQVFEDNGDTSSDFRYCYDARDQLIWRQSGGACTSGSHDEAWTYDEAGNRLTGTADASTTNFAYGGDGLLCDVETGTAASCSGGNVSHDSAGRLDSWNGWTFGYDAQGRLVSACKSPTCASGYDKLVFAYDGEGHRTSIVATDASSTVTTTEFRYQGDAVVEESVNGSVARRFVTDASGAISKMIIPTGANAGTYLVTWNGHGDALNLLRVKSDGTTELANSFSYSTWGTPTVVGSHPNSANSSAPYGDLGFRFLYVGRSDVQWDDTFGLGLLYMHARHYSPLLGRFLQPDPSRLDRGLIYARNNPTSRVDPDGWASTSVAVYNLANPNGARGLIRIALFIAAPHVHVPMTPGWWLQGDNRPHYSGAYCYRSRACLEINFSARQVRVLVAPSCGADFRYACHSAWPINRYPYLNRVSVWEGRDGRVGVTLAINQSRLPVLASFSLNFSFSVTPYRGRPSPYSLFWDGYPSVEMAVHAGGIINNQLRLREGSFWNLGAGIGDRAYYGAIGGL